MMLRMCARCERHRPARYIVERDGSWICDVCQHREADTRWEEIRSDQRPIPGSAPKTPGGPLVDEGYDIAEHRF